MELFSDLSHSLALDGALPVITEFGVTIKSSATMEIFYDLGDKTISKEVGIEIFYSEGELPSFNCPGVPESATLIENPIDMTIQEQRAYDKFMREHDVEQELLAIIKKEKQEIF